ncbi:MAG: DUF87 domain-containing protein [Candidatus Doudnabacteria bacterium]|nr:DUF87 domain-containing protein [Candidatus Doudnabacteria bacterium]
MALLNSNKKLDPERELQRELIEKEREYKKGLNTLRDLIAPSAFRVTQNSVEVSGKLARSFFVLSYPRFISVDWLAPIISLDVPMDMSMFIYPMDTEEIMKKLRNKVGQVESSMRMGQEKGNVRDPMMETALQDIEGLRDRLQQGTERYFRFSIYFTIYANEQKELDQISSTLESLLGSKLIVTKPAILQMEQGFNSTLPLGNDELAIATNMNTEPLSTTFPFVSSELTSNDGILYGINRHNNGLILFDRFQMENANSVVFAKSGSGKSYAVKLEILRSLMLGTDVIVVDPENEYQHLSNAVGGSFLSISLNSDSRVNPFDLPRAIEGETNEDILRAAVVSLLGLMNLMLGKMNPTEESIMDRAIWETYAKKDITMNSNLSNVDAPIMQDLVDILGGMVGGESLAQRLTKYTQGTFSGIFNQPTNINLNNQLVVFSVRDLEDTLRPIAIYVTLNYIWNVVRSSLKKRILVIDEAWWMMQRDDSAQFLSNMAKRARKYYLGVTTITQDVGDFLKSPFGTPIVNNSSIQLLLKQSPAAIDQITEVFHLTEGEKYLLLESDVGEGIFFAGLKHVAVKIIASYMEDQIITTDPKRALEIEEAKKQLHAQNNSQQ